VAETPHGRRREIAGTARGWRARSTERLPPEPGDGRLDGRGDVAVVGGVSGDGEQAGWVAEFAGKLAEALITASGDGHPVPALQQLAGGGGPDAGDAAGRVSVAHRC